MKRTIRNRIGDMIRGWQGKPTEADRIRYDELEKKFRSKEKTLNQVKMVLEAAVYPRPGVIPSRDFLKNTIGKLQQILVAHYDKETKNETKPNTDDQ